MATKKDNDGEIRCSFCGKLKKDAKKLVAGPPGIYICDECIGICSDIIEDDFDEAEYSSAGNSEEIRLLKPRQIKDLDGAILDVCATEEDAKKAYDAHMKENEGNHLEIVPCKRSEVEKD